MAARTAADQTGAHIALFLCRHWRNLSTSMPIEVVGCILSIFGARAIYLPCPVSAARGHLSVAVARCHNRHYPHSYAHASSSRSVATGRGRLLYMAMSLVQHFRARTCISVRFGNCKQHWHLQILKKMHRGALDCVLKYFVEFSEFFRIFHCIRLAATCSC
jgi:hypothetical protein